MGTGPLPTSARARIEWRVLARVETSQKKEFKGRRPPVSCGAGLGCKDRGGMFDQGHVWDHIGTMLWQKGSC